MRAGNTTDLPRPGPGCQNDKVCPIVTAISEHTASTLTTELYLAYLAVLVQHGTGPARRLGEGAAETAIFNLVISYAKHRARDPGSQMRLAA